jgi:hypothetical protein
MNGCARAVLGFVQGVCITLCSRNKESRVPYIEQKAGVTFERIGPPQPKEMASVAASRAVETIAQVPATVVTWFKEAAATLLQQEPDAETALAKALAKMTGVLPTTCHHAHRYAMHPRMSVHTWRSSAPGNVENES